MKIRFFLIIGLCMMLASGLFLFDPAMRTLKSHKLSLNSQKVEAKPAPSVKNVVSGTPTRITVPTLGLDIGVVNGYYDAGSKSWSLSDKVAQYAVDTPPPNNSNGNTFIYAHSLPNLFQDLHKIKKGDIVVVTTKDHKFYYSFRSAYETDPYDTSLFSYQGAPIMTLQTCSGLWFQNRNLFTFDLVRVI